MTTVDGDSRFIVVDMPIEPTTVVSALRGQISTSLQDIGEDHRYDVLLVMTELVANVLDHTPGSGRLRVLRGKVGCEITIEVDDSSALQPVHGLSRLGGTRGRGIVVVDNLARAWGTRPRTSGGKTVYASVSCAEGETAAGCCAPAG